MKFRITLVLLALIAPTVVNALGLGKLELQSALNQPFKARVKLLSATVDELDSLKVSLADQKAFDRAGVQRTFLLTQLRFEVQESENGSDYIKIRSSEPSSGSVIVISRLNLPLRDRAIQHPDIIQR